MYHAWAVLDIEPSVDAALCGPSEAAVWRGVLQSLVARSLADAGIPEAGVIPGSAPERLVLGRTAWHPIRGWQS